MFGVNLSTLATRGKQVSRFAPQSGLGVGDLAERNTTLNGGKWYHPLAEMKDGHFVMQIDGGPTLFAQHDSFATQPSRGGNGFGVAGPKRGFVQLDNLTIWVAKEQNQPGWSKRMSKFPTFTPVQVKRPRTK